MTLLCTDELSMPPPVTRTRYITKAASPSSLFISAGFVSHSNPGRQMTTGRTHLLQGMDWLVFSCFLQQCSGAAKCCQNSKDFLCSILDYTKTGLSWNLFLCFFFIYKTKTTGTKQLVLWIFECGRAWKCMYECLCVWVRVYTFVKVCLTGLDMF